MDILRKYLLSNVYRSPDDPVAAEVVVDPPADVVVADPAADPPEPSPDAGPQPDPSPEHGNKGKKPWFLDRISEEASARRAAEDRAKAAEELVTRLRTQPAADPAPPKQPAAVPLQDFDAAVDARAEQKLFYKDSEDVLRNGTTKFTDFDQTRNILQAVGALQDEFVKDVIGVDKSNAHVILDKLAKDPERTAALVRMDSRARIAELTRLSMTAAAPAAEPAAPLKPATPAKTVSRAPNPAPPVEPSASKVVDGYADNATEEQFTAQFNERMAKRSQRR